MSPSRVPWTDHAEDHAVAHLTGGPHQLHHFRGRQLPALGRDLQDLSQNVAVVRSDVDAVRFRPQSVPHEQQRHVAHVSAVALLEVGKLRLAVRGHRGQQAESCDHLLRPYREACASQSDAHYGTRITGLAVPARSQWGRA
jgi:hypothetical protein